MACDVAFDNVVTQAKLEELKLRHPAVGCAYRLGMYFDTISSLPRGFDALPECDGYSSYFEETDLEEDGLSDLMFAKIPGDSASVVDMQVAEQVLLTREKKTHRTCHATYRPSSFIKYQHSNLETKMSTTYVKNSGVYTAASSGYGTALLSPQSSSQPEYGTWGGKEEYFNSQNSQNSSDRSVKNSVINKHAGDSSTAKSPSKTSYRTKPLPPTPFELSQSPSRTIVEERPPFSNQKLFDIRRNKPVNIDAVRMHQISGSVQTLGSQASVISGDYSRPWDLKKSNIKFSSGHKSSKYDSKGYSRSSQKPQSGALTRSSSNGTTPSQLTRPATMKKNRKEFGKHLEYELEHIYESITDMDNDYDEIPEAEVLPSPSVRGLNQKVHNLSIEHSMSAVSRSMSAVPLSAVSSAGRIGKKQQQLQQQQKSMKKSPKSAATVTPATITHLNNNLSDPFGSLHKRKGQGKRRATIPEGTFVKCSDKPRSGSQPVINYGIV
ncbi:uncharacterized protein [Dysidea avara]|uniref:uncharacterized protein isoform X2 n=1 Tax=Dysidea avara TaxID=196820 RepID=UPI003317A8AE